MNRLVRFLIYTLILITPLGVFSRIEIGKNVAFYVNDLLLTLIISTYLFSSLILRKKIYFAREFFPIFAFLLAGVISLVAALRVLGPKEVLTSGLYLLRFTEYVGLGWVVSNLFRDGGDELIKKTLLISAIALSILGFVQVSLIPDFSEIAAEGGWDPHQYRLLSTFFDPNFLGLYLVLALTLVLVNFLENPKKEIIKIPLILTLAFALVLTYSRSSYVALISSFAVLGILRWRKLLVILPSVVGTVALLFPRIWARFEEGVASGTSGEARIVTWLNAVQIFRDNPLIGVGFNTYRYKQQDYGFLVEAGGHSASGTDSSLLLVLATTGIVGFIFFAPFLYMIFKLSFRLIRKNCKEGFVLIASIAAILAHSQFVNSFFYPWIMLWFWVLLGLSLAKDYEQS